MYAYYVRSAYDERKGMQSVKLESGIAWEICETNGNPVLVHPDIDYHAVWGDLFLRNDKTTNIVELEPDEKVYHSGVFILARNYKSALELLRP